MMFADRNRITIILYYDRISVFVYVHDSSMDFAVNELRDKAEDAGYNAVIGIHYSVRENEEGIFVTLMGTLVNVE